MTKKIVAIWAEDENRLIGVNDACHGVYQKN